MAAALVAGTVAMACGGDSGDDKPNEGTAGGTTAGTGDTAGPGGNAGGSAGALTLAFNPMYSAFDNGAHQFQVPVKVTDSAGKPVSGKLTVTTSPDGFVDSVAAADGVMLTTRKAGECTVTIKDADGNSGEAKLTVTQNGPGDVDFGKDRYANGIDAFTFPEGGGLPEGGLPRDADGGIIWPEGGIRALFPMPMRNEMAACTFCHVPDGAPAANGNMQQVDVEHTPTQTAGYSDQDLINIFTQAMKPAGAKWRIVNAGGLVNDATAQRIYSMFHKWSVDEGTQKGLVAYLRSLTPKAQGDIDFGGLLRAGGAGGLRPGGTGGAAGGAAAGGGGAMDAGAP